MRAIEAAQRTVYVEDQATGSPEIVAALERGVDVAVLVPRLTERMRSK